MQLEKPVSSDEVAAHFGVTVQTVNRWVRKGRIPFFRPTRRTVRFRLVEVEAALRDRSSVGESRYHGREGAERD